MSLRYVIGDATRPLTTPFGIVHVCNDVGAWGAGFTKALSHRWAEPERVFRTAPAHKRRLGHVLVATVPEGVVYNCIAQRGIGRGPDRVDYAALRNCLEYIAWDAPLRGVSLHMPRIGCGLAGGTWTSVEPVLHSTCGHLDCTIYDLRA